MAPTVTKKTLCLKKTNFRNVKVGLFTLRIIFAFVKTMVMKSIKTSIQKKADSRKRVSPFGHMDKDKRFLCLVLLSQGIIFLLISFKFHRF